MIFRAFEAVVLGSVVGFGLLIFVGSTWELYKISKAEGKEEYDSVTIYNKTYTKFIEYCRAIFIRK